MKHKDLTAVFSWVVLLAFAFFTGWTTARFVYRPKLPISSGLDKSRY